MMLFLYALVLIFFSIFSYVLIDPNITFFQSPLWVTFQDYVVYLGYYRRDITTPVYIILVLLLFFFYFYFVNKFKKYNPLKISIVIGVILLFSYPFLSHDFFNYMFDAKIVTFYHKNPYFFKALDFPSDQWLRFMHWTHRTYPYGPTFLLITLIPSFLSFGKFVISFFLFKLTFIIFYIIGVYYLKKIDNKNAMILATHPLVIIEGIISSHNDLIGLSLAIVGIYYLTRNKFIHGRLLILLSAGIKYISFPILFFSKSKNLNKIILVFQILILLFISLRMEIQPWYFLVLFAFLPFFKNLILKLNIFFAGLLFSYYPYIRLGGWDTINKVNMKHDIILVFLTINIIFLVIKKFKNGNLTKLIIPFKDKV